MQKIWESKQGDWLKGLSLQSGFSVDGFWKILQNVDPFEAIGIALPSFMPTLKAVATAVRGLKSFTSGGIGYLYGQSATKLYQILQASPFTVSDVTSQMFQAIPAGTPNKFLNSKIWKGYYVYAFQTSTNQVYIYSNSLPVNSANDVEILADATSAAPTLEYLPLRQGPDGNLYGGTYQKLHLLTSPTTIGSNSANYRLIDPGFTVREILSDGRYLVIIADNNNVQLSAAVPGRYQCKVYFWDTVQTQSGGTTILPDVVWDIDDSFIVGAEILDGEILIFGYNGLHACDSANKPVMIRPFVGSANYTVKGPSMASQITSNKGSVFWLDGTAPATDCQIFAYGHPVTGARKIFYQPYGNTGFSQTAYALVASGTNFFAADDSLNVLVYNDTTSTRGTMRAVPTSIILSQPCTFDFTKVALSQPLSSGQSVTHSAISQAATTVAAPETKSYNATKPKQTMIFKPSPATNSSSKFEELQPSITTAGGAGIQRIAVYGTLLEDGNEEL